jgi:hypothetical protein
MASTTLIFRPFKQGEGSWSRGALLFGLPPPPPYKISQFWIALNMDAGEAWWLSVVYDPSRDSDKLAFLAELDELKRRHTSPWLLAGDFNMIYCVEDKNNDLLDR